MDKHVCSEMKEEMGVDLTAYPRAITYCRVCRRALRRIPFDDLPPKTLDEVVRILRRNARRRGM